MATLDDALALFPVARDRYRELEAELWVDSRIDPPTLELCRLRLCQLLGDRVGVEERNPAADLTQDDVSAAPDWPTSPRFDDRTRACLAFTELYVVDAHAVTDDVCATLLSHVTEPEAVALTMALVVFDATSRLRIAFDLTGDR